MVADMEFFPIAALIIATFLLLIGIVGRGASMGSSQFHITLEGSIGRLPRVAILSASIVTYLLAIFLFVYAAESKSGSESSPPAQTVVVSPISGEVSNSTITVTIESELAQDVVAETDTIVIEDSEPLLLEMNEDSMTANGSFYIDAALSDRYVSYMVDVTLTDAGGNEETVTGEGEVMAGDGLSYRVTFDNEGIPVLEPA
ncbi:hypothetical protein ACFZCT_18915 [Streptomyces qaidamensis]|uniref:hypothetical protein n=1 Tax=Streptomyces qaidamensis TaxID=1783515 RepID=UPI0036E58C5F